MPKRVTPHTWNVSLSHNHRSTRTWLLYLALGIALLYAGLVSLATLFQTKLLFPVQMAAANQPILPRSAERLELTTPDGEQRLCRKF
jgi:hypothetical protein